MLPNLFLTALTILATSSYFDTSAFTSITDVYFSSSFLSATAALSLLLKFIATLYPSFASVLAISAPIPFDAPVINTVFIIVSLIFIFYII